MRRERREQTWTSQGPKRIGMSRAYRGAQRVARRKSRTLHDVDPPLRHERVRQTIRFVHASVRLGHAPCTSTIGFLCAIASRISNWPSAPAVQKNRRKGKRECWGWVAGRTKRATQNSSAQEQNKGAAVDDALRSTHRKLETRERGIRLPTCRMPSLVRSEALMSAKRSAIQTV